MRKCLPLALFKDGYCDLFKAPISVAHSIMHNKQLVGMEKVRSISLQTLIKIVSRLFGIESVDLIKLDIEGAELTVIEESIDLLRSGVIKAFAVDVADTLRHHGKEGLRKLIKYLRDAGYNCKMRKCGNELIMIATLK